jgi:hypothetical protein
MESGATDVFRPAGLIRACLVLLYGRRMPVQQGNLMPWTYCRTRSGTHEPSAHPWHQISIDSCIMGTHFQALMYFQSDDGWGRQPLPSRWQGPASLPVRVVEVFAPVFMIRCNFFAVGTGITCTVALAYSRGFSLRSLPRLSEVFLSCWSTYQMCACICSSYHKDIDIF